MFGSYRVLRWILRHYVAQDDTGGSALQGSAQDDAGGSALPMHHALKPQSEAISYLRGATFFYCEILSGR